MLECELSGELYFFCCLALSLPTRNRPSLTKGRIVRISCASIGPILLPDSCGPVKDNGKDVTWGKANEYCRQLRLGGYSDWRLATLGELKGIYDISVNAAGLAGPPKTSRAFSWHVQGDLFLTGDQWSGSLIADDRGNPSGYAWRFDFNEGRAFDDDEISFYTNNRAL